MNLTAKLKQWLIAEKLVANDETGDEVFLNAAKQAIGDGTLSAQMLVELQTEDTPGSKLMSMLETITKSVSENAKAIAEIKAPPAPAPAAAPEKRGELTADLPKAAPLHAALADSNDSSDVKTVVREIGVEEQFDRTKSVLRFPTRTAQGSVHPKAGEEVTESNRTIYESSELDKAICGAWFKAVLKSETNGRGLPPMLRMNEQDEKLIQYALHHEKWGGRVNSQGDSGLAVNNERLTSHLQKAVLDDLVSGGLEVAPIAFDDAIITYPLLYGELFPKVNLVNITRGRRIEGATVSNVTLAWSGADNSQIALEATNAFVGAFDTTIHAVDGAIEFGLDFMSDAAVDLGPVVTDSYGRRLLNDLDRVVAVGSGAGEPEGIMASAATTSVSAANGVGGPATVGDYEGLLFAVPKQYKSGFAQNAACFCANETTYRRARGIAVGATDERRVFGMDHEDYMMFSRPYSICDNMTNSQAFFGVLPRYRMYRRLGLTMRSSTEGSDLIRRNILLMTARARFGGQVEDGAAFGVITDFHA